MTKRHCLLLTKIKNLSGNKISAVPRFWLSAENSLTRLTGHMSMSCHYQACFIKIEYGELFLLLQRYRLLWEVESIWISIFSRWLLFFQNAPPLVKDTRPLGFGSQQSLQTTPRQNGGSTEHLPGAGPQIAR